MRKQTSRFKKREKDRPQQQRCRHTTQIRIHTPKSHPIHIKKETDPKNNNNNIIKEIKIKKQVWEWRKKGRG